MYKEGQKIPFDQVFSSEVLEHVFNLDEVLEEISRVLKDGGNFGFTCPFVWDPINIVGKAFGKIFAKSDSFYLNNIVAA